MFNISSCQIDNLYTWEDLELFAQVASPDWFEFIKRTGESSWDYDGEPVEKIIPLTPKETQDLLKDNNLSVVVLAGQEVSLRLRRLWNQIYDHNQDRVELLGFHLYASNENGPSFPVHHDRPHNMIIQVEGETQWELYDTYGNLEHCYRLKHQKMKKVLTKNMKAGDTFYIPSRQYHRAIPGGKRLSLSIMYR